MTVSLLALETSTRAGSIAVWEDGEITGSRMLDSPEQRPAQTLVAQIRELLQERKLRVTDLAGIAVSVGPGSFTGLRIGVVCAKTLTWAADIPVLAVDSLQVLAANVPDGVTHVDVLVPAQKGGLYVGTYTTVAGGMPVAVGDVNVQSGDIWCRERTAQHAVTGPGISRFRKVFADQTRVLPEDLWTPQAGVVARIGADLLAAGKTADVWSLEPRYMKPSSAEEQWAQRENTEDPAANS